MSSYIARFTDELGNKHTRKFFARHIYEANRKTQGIAKSNGWRVVGCGVV